MTIIYFTATGNSLHVAKTLGGKLYSIPQMMKKNKYEFTDEKIGIVCPLYSWAIPKYVENFLEKCTFNTNYLFAVITYGIYSAGVSSHIEKIAKKIGNKISYINKIKMVDNYLPRI